VGYNFVEYSIRHLNTVKTKRDDAVRITYTVAEAARVAGCGESAIRRGIREKAIPHIRFGRNIIIPRTAFHKWLDSCGRDDSGEGRETA